jgi:pyruvoyl-dependent arginine decarboxylase (PvlArgDC)
MTDEIDEMAAASRGYQRIAAGGSGRTCSSEQQRADDDAKACACRPAACDTRQPMAWAVNHAHGTTVWDSETKAREVANEWLSSRVWVWAEVVPLYRSPTLTDAERFVLVELRDICADVDDIASHERAAVIDGLLERTK